MVTCCPVEKSCNNSLIIVDGIHALQITPWGQLVSVFIFWLVSYFVRVLRQYLTYFQKRLAQGTNSRGRRALSNEPMVSVQVA